MACGGKEVLNGRQGFSCFISISNESDSVATGILLGCLVVLLMALDISFRNWCSEFGGRLVAADTVSSFADNFCPFPSAMLAVFTHPLSKGSCRSSFIEASSAVELTLLPIDCESNLFPVPAFAVSEDSTSVSLSSANHWKFIHMNQCVIFRNKKYNFVQIDYKSNILHFSISILLL